VSVPNYKFIQKLSITVTYRNGEEHQVILHKGRIAAAHVQFNRIHHIPLMHTPSNTCFLGPT